METINNQSEGIKMSSHKVVINAATNYALIVRIDRDGEQSVIHGFGRHYASPAAAEKGARRFAATRGIELAAVEIR